MTADEVGPADNVVTRPGRSTLDSVADRAGVSRQTVSNVINSPSIVAPSTAARVREAISELAYRPHPAARQLRTRRSQVLGLRVEQSNRISILDRFLHSVTDSATANDHRLMLYTADDDAAEIAAFDELVGRWNIDGFILTGTHPHDPRPGHLSAAGIPFVTFGRSWDPAEHPWVDVDGAAGTRAATEHLIVRGHTRIGFLGWPDGPGVGADRLAGWRFALQAAGLAPGPIVRCTNDLTEGRHAAAELLDLPAESVPSAVVCVSDALALGALAELGARGLRPGQDVAVIGFDDTDVAEVVGLTSLAQPLTEVAERSVRMLLDTIAGAGRPAGSALLQPRLVVRRSG